MGFASCTWPVWHVDDFTQCFRQDYLGVLFPSVAVCLSFLHLALPTLRAAAGRKTGYKPVPEPPPSSLAARHTELPPDDQCADAEDDDSVFATGGGRLALAKTNADESIIQADSPPAKNLTVVVEAIALLGLIAVNVLSILLPKASTDGMTAPAAAIAALFYTLGLVSLRLFLGHAQWRVPTLWNQTAIMYGCLWLCSVVLFRSALIHPATHLSQVLDITKFALVTLLLAICLTTRKGNKTVTLEWEGDIEPSREPLASLLSLATFSWVNAIVWKGYWETMELRHVWNLLPRDKAAAVLADYRQAKRTTSLAFHLFSYFRSMVLVQCAWAVVSGVVTFVPTLLLKAILEYIEDPSMAPKNVLWLYVILLPVSDMFRSLCDGMALWTGRKICIRIRAIIVGETYAKALRRKAAAGKESVLGSSKKMSSVNGKVGKWGRLKRKLGIGNDKSPESQAGQEATPSAPENKRAGTDEQANIGTIINLMSVDSFKISEITAYLHFLFASAPTQLIIAVYLLFTVMGLSSIPGLIVMVLLLPINIAFATGFNSTQKKIMAATDKRIHTTNEILQNIRIIKYFAWERRFRGVVDEKRAAELKALRKRFIIWAGAVAVWNTVPILITFFSFLVYTLVERKPLYPSVAFTANSLFSLLRVPLDQLGDMIAHVQESKVSIDRVEEFLMEEETEKYEQLGEENSDERGNKVIGFRDATFIWGSKSAVGKDGSMAFRLLDLNVEFRAEQLNLITGPTGSGKSSMLMALLGEMTLMKGKVYFPGGQSREDVRPDPDTGLAETCAYVAQQAWLVNASIKENILFAAPFDEGRYREVIVACALERDLEILDNGDETLVGEKGITLSGGQKQRISLARAVYSNSKHVLLDDCLSAVDSHTAKWIFNNCIHGPLMHGRTCILVSHNIPLCVPRSDYVVILDNGRIAAQGPAQDVIASGRLGGEVRKSVPGSAAVSRIPSRVPSSVGEESGATTVVDTSGDSNGQANKKKEIRKQDAMEESKAVGAVEWQVLKLYATSMGSYGFWLVTVFVFTFQQLAGVASNVWLKEWANQYTTEGVTVHLKAASEPFVGHSTAQAYFGSTSKYVASHSWSTNKSVSTSEWVSRGYTVNETYYLTILAAIGIAAACSALMRDLWVFYGSLTASWRLHNRLMEAVTRAKLKFFDITPLGQIMNRFSKDLEAVDQQVAPIAIGVITCALGIVVTVILIAAITPGFLIAGVFITLLYFFVGSFYLRASRDLKRLESVQRSPIFQQFGETLSGVTTIRAYGDERRFIRDNLNRINTQARPFIYLWACNRWLAIRTDLVGDLVAFFAGVFVIITLGGIDAGSAGLSLSYAIGFTESILWLVRLYATNEQNMNSVERIKEYLDVEQEAEAIIEKSRPPPSWPAKGAVEFVGYSTRYRPELNPVLRNVSFKLDPREKVGIVGRTGAGKSSLALSIFRALEADEGKILIDGIDISTIGLQDLREGITIVPQDPTLFTGTIRSNLDPFEIYTDEEVYATLRRVHLIGPDEETTSTSSTTFTSPNDEAEQVLNQSNNSITPPSNKNIFLNLSSPVSESGSNLSQGQRQLLCLARAMLSKSSVLVMDEATASIDYATDHKIQETIRELTSTIITIAHRLQTVIDYDKVLVLDKGTVVEFGHPWDLITKKGGMLRAMCRTSGDLDVLATAAKKAWKEKYPEASPAEFEGSEDEMATSGEMAGELR